MANNLQATPPIWILDTASATPVTTDYVAIERILWTGGASSVAGEECTVTDADGHIIFDEFSTGANFETVGPRQYPKGFHCHGIIMSALPHGKVTIFLR